MDAVFAHRESHGAAGAKRRELHHHANHLEECLGERLEYAQHRLRRLTHGHQREARQQCQQQNLQQVAAIGEGVREGFGMMCNMNSTADCSFACSAYLATAPASSVAGSTLNPWPGLSTLMTVSPMISEKVGI